MSTLMGWWISDGKHEVAKVAPDVRVHLVTSSKCSCWARVTRLFISRSRLLLRAERSPAENDRRGGSGASVARRRRGSRRAPPGTRRVFTVPEGERGECSTVLFLSFFVYKLVGLSKPNKIFPTSRFPRQFCECSADVPYDSPTKLA